MLEWNSKCLLPLREPNFERDITISIEQNVGGKNELISRTVLDVEDAAILEADWYNLYGAHWDLTKYPSLRAANHFVAKQMNSALIEPTCFGNWDKEEANSVKSRIVVQQLKGPTNHKSRIFFFQP